MACSCTYSLAPPLWVTARLQGILLASTDPNYTLCMLILPILAGTAASVVDQIPFMEKGVTPLLELPFFFCARTQGFWQLEVRLPRVSRAAGLSKFDGSVPYVFSKPLDKHVYFQSLIRRCRKLRHCCFPLLVFLSRLFRKNTQISYFWTNYKCIAYLFFLKFQTILYWNILYDLSIN